MLATDRFLLVTNNHRAGRARLQDPDTEQKIVFTDGARVQAVFSAHIQRRGSVGTPPRRNWHFLPMPGTTVTVPAGPGAAPYLADIASYRPEPLASDDEGFTHYRLHL